MGDHCIRHAKKGGDVGSNIQISSRVELFGTVLDILVEVTHSRLNPLIYTA